MEAEREKEVKRSRRERTLCMRCVLLSDHLSRAVRGQSTRSRDTRT